MKITKNNRPTRKQQHGMASIDTLITTGAFIAGIAVVLVLSSEVTSSGQQARLQTQIATIKNAAVKWKGNAANFNGVDMTTLCADNYLGDDICGGTNGIAANAFGGDFIVAANTNPGLLDVGVTMPSDPGSVNMVARSLASMTRDRCTDVAGCATIQVNGTTITNTF